MSGTDPDSNAGQPVLTLGGVAFTKGRLVLIGIILLTLVAVAFSLTTNLSRMYETWGDSQRRPGTAGTAGAGGSVQAALERLDVVSGDRRHTFMVEVMRNDHDRGRGLMFRAAMPQNQGMLFDFERDQMVSMWMKNTYLSLDMVFIFADGRIHRIESRTEPESEKVISSGVPVRAVLELNANVASRLSLRPGDRLIHPMFK